LVRIQIRETTRGASSPDPVIRLRQAVVGAAAGVFAVTGRLAIFGLASSRRQRDG
jgi:hypothetical protein